MRRKVWDEFKKARSKHKNFRKELKNSTPRKKLENEYALYKGEDVLAIGTIEEIVKIMGVKRSSVMFLNTPSYKKRVFSGKGHEGNQKILVYIGKKEETQ